MRDLLSTVTSLETRLEAHCDCGSTSGESVANLTSEDVVKSTSTALVEQQVKHFVLNRPPAEELMKRIAMNLTSAETVPSFEDPVERRLLSEYEDINEQVVLNERVLEACAKDLENTPISDVAEMARRQEENMELKELIEAEIDKRSSALTALIVYMWRHSQGELVKMLDDKSAGNQLHVQHATHHRCAKLATEITERREYARKIKRQVDATMEEQPEEADVSQRRRQSTVLRLGGMLTKVEQKVAVLEAQRRREFATLIHFDKRVRLLIKAQLARST